MEECMIVRPNWKPLCVHIETGISDFSQNILHGKGRSPFELELFFYLTLSCQYTIKHCIHEHGFFFFFGQINVKVSDIIIYIMKTMWKDFKKFVRVVSEIYKKALKSPKFWMKLHLNRWWENGLVFKIENTPKFPNIEIWY